MAAEITGLLIKKQNGTDNTLFATWGCVQVASQVDSYRVTWSYSTGNSYRSGRGSKPYWFSGESSNVKGTIATYTPPSNAKSVKVTVKAIAKKQTSYRWNKKGKKVKVTKPFFNGKAKSKTYRLSQSFKPENVSAPSVSIGNVVTSTDTVEKPNVLPDGTVDGNIFICIYKYKLTAVLDNIMDSKAKEIEFYVVQDTTPFTSGTGKVVTNRASFSCDVPVGHKYRVRCRAINTATGEKSAWSEYSSEVQTVPYNTIGEPQYSVETETSVKLYWAISIPGATSYEVQYTTNESYFDSSSEVSSVTSEKTYVYITGLEPGHKYYFRVRAINDQGESNWSHIIQVQVGTVPTAPTTWSLSTTAIVGENVVLYWMHNCEDGSKQSGSEIELIIDGVTEIKDGGAGEEDKASSYTLDLSGYTGGAEILWRVRTRGVTNTYGPWSVQRTIKLYAPVTLTLELGDSAEDTSSENVLSSFPYRIAAAAWPSSQKHMGYHISIIAQESYETTDATGEDVWVNEGAEIFSRQFNMSDDTNRFVYQLSAGDVYLVDGISYKVIVDVVMDTGLTAEAEDTFTVSWTDESYIVDGSVFITPAFLIADIFPECRDMEENLVENVTLAVYRRDYDGGFTEIASGIENTGSPSVTDLHPALDYARYRIVARNELTGRISFADLVDEPVLESSLVIQWDEMSNPVDIFSEELEEVPPWTGSMVWLPYNVSVSESHDPDVSLVEYIGRKNPVSYYGTQRGESATWSADIPMEDTETIAALRKLAVWPGDVYVREPSGIGYWANVVVSMSMNRRELIVPVSLTVKRVEGSGP